MTVLVVGAGPTGLVAACYLRLYSVDVRVVDRASKPATTSRALGLQPRGVEVLQRIDALGDLPERVRPAGYHLYANGRMTSTVKIVTADGTIRPLVIGQTAIEATLRARLAELSCTGQQREQCRSGG